jgi:HJR/Mrr/RecB family endonuclease
MKVVWSQLTPNDFEKLCGLLLEKLGFTNIQWYGKSGGDKARDFIAMKEDSPLPSSKRIAKWVVQCKRYVTKPPSKRDIQSFFYDALEHNPDNVLLIVTNTLAANTKDWIEAVRQTRQYPFDIHYWEELDLEREIARNRSWISERLPGVLSQPNPVILEEVNQKQKYVFSSPQIREIKIVVFNKASEKKAKEDVMEFIRFLRENDVTFSWQDDPPGSA